MNFIASRTLMFSKRHDGVKRKVTVKISAPYVVDQSDVDFPVDGTTAGCRVEIDGMEEGGFDLYGMDTLQAVHLASDIEPLLKRLSLKYDFFWLTGEPYFEE